MKREKKFNLCIDQEGKLRDYFGRQLDVKKKKATNISLKVCFFCFLCKRKFISCFIVLLAYHPNKRKTPNPNYRIYRYTNILANYIYVHGQKPQFVSQNMSVAYL